MYISPRRLLALWRSACPCLYLIPALIGGQLAGFCLGGSLSSGVMYAAAGSSLLPLTGIRFRPGLGLAGIFLAGFVSMRAALPAGHDPSLNSDESWLVQVEGPVRRRKPGGVELSLELLGIVRPGARSIARLASTRLVLCRAVELPWRNVQGAEQGSVFIMRASFARLKRDSGLLEYDAMLLRRGYEATCKLKYASPLLYRMPSAIARVRDRLFSRITQTLGEGEHTGLFLSLALGARDQLGRHTDEAFKRTGLAHLLVFSGYQVMLVYYSAIWVMKASFRLSLLMLAPFWYRISRFVPPACLFNLPAVLLAVSLVLLAGVEGSSLRAALATVIVAVVRIFERGGGMLNSIVLSFTIISLVWPGSVLEPGIQLTYGALAGIWLGSMGRDQRGKIAGMIHTGICVWLITSAIVLIWFDLISPAGLVLNLLLAAPVSFVACNLGYLSIAFLWAGIDPHGWCLKLCAGLLWQFRNLVLSVDRVPYVSFEPEGEMKWILAAGLLAALARFVTRRKTG